MGPPKFHAFGLCLFVALFFFSPSSSAIKYTKEEYQKKLREKKTFDRLTSVQLENFEVLSKHSLSDAIRQEMARIINQAKNQIGLDLQYNFREPVRIVLLDDYMYGQLEDNQMRTAGIYSNKTIRINFQESSTEAARLKHFQQVLTHEMAHFALHSLDGGKLPRWLDEGVAQYEEEPQSQHSGLGKAFYEKMKKQGKDVSPQKLFNQSLAENYSKDMKTFYEHAYVVTAYLIDHYGFEKFREMLKQMKSNKSFHAAFQAVYGGKPETIVAGAYKY